MMWHYTLGTTLLQIVADRHIRRARAFVKNSERRAVWFSGRQVWEPTATKRYRTANEDRKATAEEMVYAGGALVRIGVAEDVARHTWAHHRQHSGIDPRMADALERAARTDGAEPAEWRVSYHDVPLSAIRRIEASDDGVNWRDIGEPAPEGALALDPDFLATLHEALGRRTGGA